MKTINDIISTFLPLDDEGKSQLIVTPLGNGLINTTFKVESACNEYVLQKINTSIFPDVEQLQRNITIVTDHLRRKLNERGENDLNRKVLEYLPTKTDPSKTYIIDEEGDAWRMMRYISGSETREEVTPETAREAGIAFGQFQKDLSDIDIPLTETIPGFHDMILRLKQLKQAVASNPAGRADGAKDLLDLVEKHTDAMTMPERLRREGKLPIRICHCDTKVNNMLYDAETGKVLCVIDLDTVMPSTVFSDYGDFLRTAANTAPEDEPDLDKIHFREDIYKAFTEGYLSVAENFLTEEEIHLLPVAVALFPYMQGVRFLTDWINGDVYYKIAYPEHNLVRARAQFRLFEEVLKARLQINL